jgi:hypothetical protein
MEAMLAAFEPELGHVLQVGLLVAQPRAFERAPVARQFPQRGLGPASGVADQPNLPVPQFDQIPRPAENASSQSTVTTETPSGPSGKRSMTGTPSAATFLSELS